MPVFECIKGITNSIALDKEGCFAVEDATGETWLCFEIPQPSEGVPVSAVEMARMHQVLEKNGIEAEGSQLRQHTCSKEELPDRLGRPIETKTPDTITFRGGPHDGQTYKYDDLKNKATLAAPFWLMPSKEEWDNNQSPSKYYSYAREFQPGGGAVWIYDEDGKQWEEFTRRQS